MDIDEMLKTLSANDKRLLLSALQIFKAQAIKVNTEFVERMMQLEDKTVVQELREMVNEHNETMTNFVILLEQRI